MSDDGGYVGGGGDGGSYGGDDRPNYYDAGLGTDKDKERKRREKLAAEAEASSGPYSIDLNEKMRIENQAALDKMRSERVARYDATIAADEAKKEAARQYDLMRELALKNVPIVRNQFGNEIRPGDQVGFGPGPNSRVYPSRPFGGYNDTYETQAKEFGYDPEVYARAGGFVGRRDPVTVEASRRMNLLNAMQARGMDPQEAKSRLTVTSPISVTPTIGVKSEPAQTPQPEPIPRKGYGRKTAMRNMFPQFAGIFDLINEAYA